MDLLTADYTFLNEQLARHYGVRNVYGSHFRRTTLTDENRWGLLGKASVLAVTSYPTRTSPTIRGKWLLENILAAPVPPPPPDVNTTLDEGTAAQPSSVREMLERHRTNPVCASSMRGWTRSVSASRTSMRSVNGARPTPMRRSTPAASCSTVRRSMVPLRFAARFAQKEQFVQAVTRKLMTYAVGRELKYYDAPAIRSMRALLRRMTTAGRPPFWLSSRAHRFR